MLGVLFLCLCCDPGYPFAYCIGCHIPQLSIAYYDSILMFIAHRPLSLQFVFGVFKYVY